MQNNLEQIWRSEVGRFKPEQASFSLGEIISMLLEKIAAVINTILKNFDFAQGVSTSHLKKAGIVIVTILVLLLARYIYNRRHFFLRTKTGVSGKSNEEPARIRYARFISSGDYTAALRLLVRYTGDSTRGAARTFRELFRRNDPAERNDSAATYGGLIHCNYSVDKTDLEKCEKLLSVSYPDIHKKLFRKKRP